jgi:U3 small nucleolar RNA-associated protein 25
MMFRYRLRGIRNLIYYGPTYYADFYPEIVNMIGDSTTGDDLSLSDNNNVSSTIVVLYTRYDSLALERIVGTDRVDTLVYGEKASYLFA